MTSIQRKNNMQYIRIPNIIFIDFRKWYQFKREDYDPKLDFFYYKNGWSKTWLCKYEIEVEDEDNLKQGLKEGRYRRVRWYKYMFKPQHHLRLFIKCLSYILLFLLGWYIGTNIFN